jgi:hypothetical protein
MQDNGILPDIDLEGCRAPPTDGLNCGNINTSFCERSGAAGPQRMTSIVPWKKGTEPRDEPVSSGDTAAGSEPELGVKRKEGITGSQIREERTIGIGGGGEFLYEDGVPFEGAITLVWG